MSEWNDAIDKATAELQRFYAQVQANCKCNDKDLPADAFQLKAIALCGGIVATLRRKEL
jgi:hypothetical protein